MKAIGFLDKLQGGIRVYIIEDRKDRHGDNIVLHESWHVTRSDAERAYRTATRLITMKSEYTNIPYHFAP